VVIKPFTDQQAMVVNLETGVIDVIARPLFSDVKRLKEKGKFKVDVVGGLANDVMFNVKAPPYDNKKVRQAINYAIDRKKFTDMYYYGFSEPWYLPVPKHSLAYFPDLDKKYEFDLEKAKQLLTEAGYPDGFEDTMVYSTRKAKGSNVLAQIMQADLRKIGIRLKLRDYEPAVMRPMEFRSEFTIHPHVYGRASKDPAGLFGTTVAWSPLDGIAIHQFQDEEYAKLLEEGQTTLDKEKRREIYRKVITLLLDECFTIPISAQPLPYVMQTYVNGMKYNQDSYPQMETVWVDK
jgi:peptide/nickel transport system substrate-binding protein